MYEEDQRLAVEQALAGALARSIAQSDKKGDMALKASLAEAMGKFSPDRTVLPIPYRTFGGAIGRTMDSVGSPTGASSPGRRPPRRAKRAGRPRR